MSGADPYKISPVAIDVNPVPPYITPTDVVAETTPPFACSGPFRPENRFSVPMLATVADAVLNDPYVVDENANVFSAEK